MPNGRKRWQGEPRGARLLRCRSFCILHSAIGIQQSFTLIEMLVLIAMISILAGMIGVVLMTARRISIRVECQEHLRQIGQTLNQIMLNNSGIYPLLRDSDGFPWWARVYQQWEGNPNWGGTIDANVATPGLQLPRQLPDQMKIFRCRAGGPALSSFPDESDNAKRVDNLDSSISYGLNFDVMDSDGKPYHAKRDSLPTQEEKDKYSARFPSALTADDKKADEYRYTHIRSPNEFILLSEANAEGLNQNYPTGGRISMAKIVRGGSDDPKYNAPIVGRHRGMANVLFADMHVESVEVAEGETSATRNINWNTRLWTLPDD